MQYTKICLFFYFTLVCSYGEYENYNWKFECINGEARKHDHVEEAQVCNGSHQMRVKMYGIDCCNERIRQLKEFAEKIQPEFFNITVSSLSKIFKNKLLL